MNWPKSISYGGAETLQSLSPTFFRHPPRKLREGMLGENSLSKRSLWPHRSSTTLTLLWAQMAEPRSFHVPPLRSIRSMRRICRKRRLRREVARTFPWFPTATTGTEAISTKMSGREDREVEKERGPRKGQFQAMDPSQTLPASNTSSGPIYALPCSITVWRGWIGNGCWSHCWILMLVFNSRELPTIRNIKAAPLNTWLPLSAG